MNSHASNSATLSFKLNSITRTLVCLFTSSLMPTLALANENNQVESSEIESNEIETIEVTASKRSQNIQDIPTVVTAFDESDIEDHNIGNFDEFVRYLPYLTLGGRGPGQSDIYIRGMAIQPIAVMLSGAQGTNPNVALYIDEQPVSAPGRNLDVYATDLERIEVLPGPQGSLFGASSQAGTVRYITNKPQDEFDAKISTAIETTKSGEPSYRVEGFVNAPLTDKLSFRATFYEVQRGGYIDNVYGEFTLDPNENTQVANSVKALPDDTQYQSTNNETLVEKNFNDSSYSGFRVGAKYQLAPQWQLLVQHAEQTLEADGVFDYDPELDDLEVQRYFPDKLNDEFKQTSITLSGVIDELELLYAGSFLDRDIEQSIDYTGYNNVGAYIPWYTCSYTSETTPYRECLDPTKGFKGKQNHQRSTHEFRISTDVTKPLRFIGGVYLDNFQIKTQDDYYYQSAPALGFVPNAPISTSVMINPNARPEQVTFFNDITRTDEQLAVFGEASYQLFKDFTATLGLRWYSIESDFAGSSNFADQGEDGDSGRDYDQAPHGTEPLKMDDVIKKVNFSYAGFKDILLFATYSEGFRPGGFNRGGGLVSSNPEFPSVSLTYETDDVTNIELGYKSLLFDKQLKLNMNMYAVTWNDLQLTRFDPENVSILTFVENAADAKIYGFEADSVYRVNNNLTFLGALSLNKTELTDINAKVIEVAPVGSSLPLTPELQFNLRLKYDWEIASYYANWQLGYQYASESYSSIVAENRQKQQAYQTVNASIELERDNWKLKFYADNLTDERAQLFINDQDDIVRVTTNRPQTFGLSLTYRYD